MEKHDNPFTKDRTANALFLGRRHCEATLKALAHLKNLNYKVTFIQSTQRGEPLPREAIIWHGEYILSFRSLFILPKKLLKQARIAAINFHPAPPEYPGSGCLNFALFEKAELYGVTAHLMDEKIDHGEIIDCRRFPIVDTDTVDTLLTRTHQHLLELFCDVTTGISIDSGNFIHNKLLNFSNEKWKGKARKLSELDKLQIIDANASREEIERIIRSTYTELFPPKIVLHGFEFILKNPNRN